MTFKRLRGQLLNSSSARRDSVPHKWTPTTSAGEPLDINVFAKLRRSLRVFKSAREVVSLIGQPSARRCSGLMWCGFGATLCGE